MNPILYDANETDFSKIGYGVLSECLSCVVEEELNGKYEAEFTYPVKGTLYNYIAPKRIVKIKASETTNPQLFRIYKQSKPINGIVRYFCQHISYDLNAIAIKPFAKVESANAATALNTVLHNSLYPHSFTATSDINTTHTIDGNVPRSARKWLGGVEGSLLDLYHGEYEFDNFQIKYNYNRGYDNGVTISYGKNLTDVTQELDVQSMYSALYPYVIDNDGNYIELPEKIIVLNENAPGEKILVMDFSDKINDDVITVAKLRNRAIQYASQNRIAYPKQNITVSFVQLWQSKEYSNLSSLERVKMGDYVTVEYNQLGISAKLEVIKTKYDSLMEKYISVELGNAKSNMSSTLATMANNITEYKNQEKSAIRQAIERQTALITGGMGGYVVIELNENTGYPEEILIMDTPDKSTAVNVWRFNQGGLGHSHNGYNGPFDDVALTANGEINATMITTGVFNANLIQSGTLNANLIKSGILSDVGNTTRLNLSTGQITIAQDNGSLELWRGGVTIKDANDNVKTSMFESTQGKGALTANIVLVGERDNEKVRLNINSNDKGVISGDIVNTDSLTTNTITVDGITLDKNSSNELHINRPVNAPVTIRVNGSQVGAFYATVAGDSILETGRLKVDGNFYHPRQITVNGNTYTVLAQ